MGRIQDTRSNCRRRFGWGEASPNKLGSYAKEEAMNKFLAIPLALAAIAAPPPAQHTPPATPPALAATPAAAPAQHTPRGTATDITNADLQAVIKKTPNLPVSDQQVR